MAGPMSVNQAKVARYPDHQTDHRRPGGVLGKGVGLVKARAVHFVAPRRVELREVELPAPAEGQLLVAAEWSGISSGTELLAYRGEIDPDLPLDETLGALAGTFAYPFRYGYSAVGRVLRPAAGFREGQLVFAFHPHQDRFVVDAGDAMAVDGPEARVATMYPMVETALQVCLDAAPRLGEVVVVVGLGAVGVLAPLPPSRSACQMSPNAAPSPRSRPSGRSYRVHTLHDHSGDFSARLPGMAADAAALGGASPV